MSVGYKRMDILKVLMLVSILIISGLSITFGTIGNNANINEFGLSDAGESVSTARSSRQGMVESVAPTTIPASFVGQQDINWEISLQSLAADDYNDMNGDNVIYVTSVAGTNADDQAGNLQRYNAKTRQFENVNTPVFQWDTNIITPTSTDKNSYNLYAKGDPAMGDWKYVMNQSNSFLDEDNDGLIEAEEYWAIQTGPKDFGNFVVNINKDAKPGYYRMKFQVDYNYMSAAPLNESGVGNGSSSSITNSNLFTNEALGPFKYFYWVPWDEENGTIPTNLVETYSNNTANFDFRKRVAHTDSGSTDYDNIWEAIPDNGAATPTSHPDINGDNIQRWVPNYPGALYTGMSTLFQPIITNYPGTPIIDQISNDQSPNANQGNGTWTYTGNISEDITWEQHSDEVWFDFIINSTLQPEADLNEDNKTNDLKLKADDGDYYTGGVFEEFYIPMTNIDPNNEMRDVSAQLTLPTGFAKGGMEFYGGFDTTKINTIDPMDSEDFAYRLKIEKDTPPGYYYGSLVLKYTKRYDTGQFDPLGNPLTTDIDVTEDHWVVEFEVDYTPDMGDAKVSLPALQVRGKPTTEIDVSTGIQVFEFEIKNTGNVELWGGNKSDGNVHMQFAEFQQMGKGYYDSDADPGVDLEPIQFESIDVGETITRQIPIKIPHHWYLPEGVYRLYLNFTGYYYNDGALGDPTGFIYMEMDWDGANDDNANRTCHVKVDENGNERIDAEGVDSYRMTEGIYTDIYIKKLDPKTKELAIVNYTPMEINQEELEGGAHPFSITFQNPQTYNMYNVYVEVDIEGYFDESAYYDWTTVTYRPNPKFYMDQLMPLHNWTVNFTIDDVDKMLPQGEHHIPIKYAYDYYEYPGAEEMSTFSIIWDTSGSPFKPYVDTNANFMLNKGGSTRAGNMYDIVFVVDSTHRTSSTYRNRLRDSIDDFKNELINNGINYQFALVGFNENAWVEKGFTSDSTQIQAGINNLVPVNYNCGVYDAVTETIRNNFVGQQLSYRPGATKVIIIHTDYYPSQGSSDETQFALAVKGEAIFFAVARTGYYYQYDLTTQNTGGQLFDVRASSGLYITFMENIASALTSQTTGVSPTGMVIADVPLEDVVDPVSVNMDTYGPYIIVNVIDHVFDIDTRATTTLDLGDEIRNINLNVILTNEEYVQYTDLEVWLPLNDTDGQTVFFNPHGTQDPIEGSLSSKTLAPNGGTVSATFNLDLNTDIDSGIYTFELPFKAMHDYTKQILGGSIMLEVRVYPRDPILIIPQQMDDDGEYNGKAEVKAKVTPGKEFILEFQLQNVGDDIAREVFITMSNDWYSDDPFTTIEAFISSYYPDGQGGDIVNSPNSNIVGVPQKCDRSLDDLGISSTSDIIDAERQLLSPTAIVPRFYIEEIQPGETVTVKFRMRADTHMVKGRPYKEFVLVEYMDSDGLTYSYQNQNQIKTQPLPIIITTEDNDIYPDEEPISSSMLAVLLILIILIIIILLYLGSMFNKRRLREEGEMPDQAYEDELIDDEDMEDEDMEEEELEDEIPSELKEQEEEPKKEEPDWEPEEPEDDEDEEEDEDEDEWDIEEDKAAAKPAKGPAPRPVVAGKQPAKAPKDEDNIDDW